MLVILKIVQLLIPIVIAMSIMGFKNKNASDYIKILQLQRHESHLFFKIIFTQVSIYISLFFTSLVMCGIVIKEQIPKKLIIIGSIVQILLCMTSSYFLMQFHNDMNRLELILCSLAFGLNGLLFTLDAIIMFQQMVFSRQPGRE